MSPGVLNQTRTHQLFVTNSNENIMSRYAERLPESSGKSFLPAVSWASYHLLDLCQKATGGAAWWEMITFLVAKVRGEKTFCCCCGDKQAAEGLDQVSMLILVLSSQCSYLKVELPISLISVVVGIVDLGNDQTDMTLINQNHPLTEHTAP